MNRKRASARLSTSPLGVTLSKRRAIVLALLCALGGLVAGALGALWFAGVFLNYSVATSAVAKIVVEGTALQRLHDGDIDGAVRYLQTNLDPELITVAAAQTEGFKVTPGGRTAIGHIKRLRDSTGYAPTDPAMRKMVDDALALGR